MNPLSLKVICDGMKCKKVQLYGLENGIGVRRQLMEYYNFFFFSFFLFKFFVLQSNAKRKSIVDYKFIVKYP